MKPTKVPWKFRMNQDSEGRGTLHGFDIVEESTSEIVGHCFYRGTDGEQLTLDQAAANANFIVTACNAHHDLLEACKYVVSWHREHDSGEGELFGLDFVTTCISAITKGTGG